MNLEVKTSWEIRNRAQSSYSKTGKNTATFLDDYPNREWVLIDSLVERLNKIQVANDIGNGLDNVSGLLQELKDDLVNKEKEGK